MVSTATRSRSLVAKALVSCARRKLSEAGPRGAPRRPAGASASATSGRKPARGGTHARGPGVVVPLRVFPRCDNTVWTAGMRKKRPSADELQPLNATSGRPLFSQALSVPGLRWKDEPPARRASEAGRPHDPMDIHRDRSDGKVGLAGRRGAPGERARGRSSNSASPPKTVSISRPCAVVVSAHVSARDLSRVRPRARSPGENAVHTRTTVNNILPSIGPLMPIKSSVHPMISPYLAIRKLLHLCLRYTRWNTGLSSCRGNGVRGVIMVSLIEIKLTRARRMAKLAN